MRCAAYASALLLSAAIAPQLLTSVIATGAATLLESSPFIFAGALALALPLRWSAGIVPYLGCGCGAGPSARSLPAAFAAWAVFGPFIACARVAAAVLVGRAGRRPSVCEHGENSTLAQLAAVTPFAALGGLGAAILPLAGGLHPNPIAAFAGGAFAAFLLAPCGLGAIGMASALRGPLAGAAAGILCVAGIFDLRVWSRAPAHGQGAHDMPSYALAAAACSLVAARGGGDLVHPVLACALWPCAAGFGWLAVRHTRAQTPALRIAPAIMLAGSILSAPPPQYHATETTLADAFAGERIEFTGIVTRTGNRTTLVRYAITCCRADAAPIVVRLAQRPFPALRGWAHATGTLEDSDAGLVLRCKRLESITPPADPFVYR